MACPQLALLPSLRCETSPSMPASSQASRAAESQGVSTGSRTPLDNGPPQDPARPLSRGNQEDLRAARPPACLASANTGPGPGRPGGRSVRPGPSPVDGVKPQVVEVDARVLLAHGRSAFGTPTGLALACAWLWLAARVLGEVLSGRRPRARTPPCSAWGLRVPGILTRSFPDILTTPA